MAKASYQDIAKELVVSYTMELETVMNYIANSEWLDGIKAKHVKQSLAADVQEELGHAQMLAKRIKVLDGRVPGSLELQWGQKSMQPPESSVDVRSVVQGVIEAEEGAIAQYQKIIDMTDGVDAVTQDLCIELMGDEQEHRREFVGYLKELDA